MSRKFYTVFSSILFVVFLCTACGKPTPEPTAIPTAVPTEVPTLGEGVTICQVTDTSGMVDGTLNAVVWAGIEKAETQLGIAGKYLESQDEADYANNINSFIEDDCNLIVASGFSTNDAVKAAAEANPDQWFYIVDADSDLSLPNVTGQVFNVGEAAFLAGFAAAGATQNAKVGSFGSEQTPIVTAYMDGFYAGVQYYNAEHETNIQVLGWNPEEQAGVFMEGAGIDDARTMAEDLVDQGADIIMPVVDTPAFDTIELALELRNIYIIGVVTDWAATASKYADGQLTSVLKNADDTTFAAIRAAVEGNLSAGSLIGTLSNGGVSIAPVTFRPVATTADVTSWMDTLKIEVKEVETRIKAGEIQTIP